MADFEAAERRVGELQSEMKRALDCHDLDAAREAAEEALDAVKVHFGEKHPVYAASLNNLAFVSKEQGALGEAMARYQQAYDLYMEVHQDSASVSAAACLTNLGAVRRQIALQMDPGASRMQLADEAVATLQEALDMRKVVLQPDDPQIAVTMYHLAGAIRDHTGPKDPRSQKLFQEAVERLRRKPGPDSLMLATALNNFGLHCKLRGDFNAGLQAYHEALGIREAQLPEDHPVVLVTLHNIAELLAVCGKEEESNHVRTTLLRRTGMSEEEIEAERAAAEQGPTAQADPAQDWASAEDAVLRKTLGRDGSSDK